MHFTDHTLNWIKGELFESKMIIAFGIVTILAGIMFLRVGTTPAAKALVLPLLITGLVYAAIGGNMLYSNQKRIKELPGKFQVNETTFVQMEKQRVESFQYQYKISKAVATVFFISTVIIFWVTKNPTWQAVAIGLSLFGLAGLIVDYFSEERAGIYYREILKYL